MKRQPARVEGCRRGHCRPATNAAVVSTNAAAATASAAATTAAAAAAAAVTFAVAAISENERARRELAESCGRRASSGESARCGARRAGRHEYEDEAWPVARNAERGR